MRLSSPKVHLSKTIHDWLRLLRIALYRAIIYAFFSKRAKMTVTWSNFVNNTLISSRKRIGDQSIVNKMGPGNRHFGTFDENG